MKRTSKIPKSTLLCLLPSSLWFWSTPRVSHPAALGQPVPVQHRSFWETFPNIHPDPPLDEPCLSPRSKAALQDAVQGMNETCKTHDGFQPAVPGCLPVHPALLPADGAGWGLGAHPPTALCPAVLCAHRWSGCSSRRCGGG